ncbi:hypothetical protein OX284_003480 [Flavobacterium sp. SUN046]|uniref:hypothetical protein n=1 Tax=Flavobacterium sp. SUN046 TaxID=3002440 RepID=UPI002DB71955|nr:hypothetical protein [Flavobacterium sp. SUN046]MEC4048478.1 hypothetical protein [Flavobacterium sp. SUN046]
MNNKTLIYDSSRGFSRMIKRYYSCNMNIDVCSNRKNFLYNKYTDYKLCFFIINDLDDFLNLKKIYFEIEHVIIATSRKIFEEKLINMNLEDVLVLDLQENKRDLIKSINFKLQENNLI